MKPEMMYELRVLTGLHRGAALPLNGEEWSIGACSESDLALYDPGIKDRHCLLRLVDDTWSLARKDGPVTDSEGHKVDAIATLLPGTPFAVNGVWLSVVSANTEWDEEAQEVAAQQPSPQPLLLNAEDEAIAPPPLKAPRPLLGPVLLVTALLLFLAALVWALNHQAPAPAVPATPGKIVLENAAAVRQVLQDMLKERELDQRVSIVEEHGKLLLKGHFAEDDLLQSTSRLILRFEQRYRSPIAVDNALPPATDALPFSIVQISNARLPNVLTSDGRRLFLGDEVEGVRLVDISEHKVIFDGDQRVELSW